MDPDTTYNEWQDALRHNDLDAAIDHASDLAGWLAMSGFTPREFNAVKFGAFCASNDVEC